MASSPHLEPDHPERNSHRFVEILLSSRVYRESATRRFRPLAPTEHPTPGVLVPPHPDPSFLHAVPQACPRGQVLTPRHRGGRRRVRVPARRLPRLGAGCESSSHRRRVAMRKIVDPAALEDFQDGYRQAGERWRPVPPAAVPGTGERVRAVPPRQDDRRVQPQPPLAVALRRGHAGGEPGRVEREVGDARSRG